MYRPGAQGRPSLLHEVGVDGYLERLAPILERYRPMEIFLGGPGEPLIEPGFRELATALLNDGHFVHVTTNGISVSRLLEVARDAINTEALTCEIAFHAGPLRRRGSMSSVLDNAAKLGELGILSSVLALLSPGALAGEPTLVEALELIQSAGPGPRIRLRRLSHFDGERRFPDSYTASERSQIRQVLDSVPQATLSPSGDPELLPMLAAPLELRGAPCVAPMRVLNVGLDGGLWDCYADPFRPRALGHLDRGFRVDELYKDGPVPCEYAECLCRVLGIEHCLEAHGVSLRDYCATYHELRGDAYAAEKLRRSRA
jgi:hypothetical protein